MLQKNKPHHRSPRSIFSLVSFLKVTEDTLTLRAELNLVNCCVTWINQTFQQLAIWDKRCGLFFRSINGEEKKFYWIATWKANPPVNKNVNLKRKMMSAKPRKTLGACLLKLFTAAINTPVMKASVLVTKVHFHPYLIFVRKWIQFQLSTTTIWLSTETYSQRID